MDRITFVTGNANKLAEVEHILGPSVSLRSQAIDLPETQGTINEVARAKCLAAAEIVGGPVLTEDTSLHFRALSPQATDDRGSELPGPYIKWFLRDLGLDGLNTMLAGFDDKRAVAICTFAYCEGPSSFNGVQHPVLLFRGECEGNIVRSRGSTAFGWDAIFECPELDNKTFGEATKQEKATVSHRYRALAKLREHLEAQTQNSH
ncbi:nucleoside triphosphate pyrophosphohydrolase ham1 [Savitreella phatthalungensis]